MKNKTMHVLVFVLSCIGFGSGLIGCGSHKKEASDKVVIWHWMTDRDAAFKTLAQKYTEQTGHPKCR